MTALEYERVVRELCTSLDARHEWPEVARSQHVQLDGTDIGLIHDEATTGDNLCVFLDLGVPIDAGTNALALLTANATIGPADRGYFALHPEHERVVFCTNIALTPALTGESLGQRLLTLIDDARDALQRGRAA